MKLTDPSHHHHHDEHEHATLPPWMRPAEPDHPMMIDGGVTSGDAALMLRCMVEEYLLAGHAPQAILAMCENAEYQAFHAAMHSLGRDRAAAIISDAAKRVGHHHVQFSESTATAQATTLTISAPAGAATH